MSGTIDQILGYFFFPAAAFVAMTISAVYVIRQHSPTPATYSTPGYPVTPALILVLVAVLLALLAMEDPLRTGIGVAVVLLGLPVYLLVFRRRV